MDDMVERVLSLCPECDRDEVERDLNVTADVEWTLNRALDGLLSPKSSLSGTLNKTNPITIVMDDDDDDVVVMPSSTFTNVKERSETKIAGSDVNTSYNNAYKPSLNSIQTSKPVRNSKRNNRTSFELSDADSELTDISENCRRTLEKMKSTIINLETSNSKTLKHATSESVPSSPDSDSELLKPVFDCNQHNRFPTKISKQGYASDGVSNKKDSQVITSGVKDIEALKDFSTNSEPLDDVCLEEPVRKKKRTKAEIEERKREAMLKRTAKEKEKQEKLEEKKRQKEVRTAAAQEKKLQKEKDQLYRKAERLTKSANRLDGCMKFITACLDPALFSENPADPDTNLILQKLSSLEANYVIISQAYPGSVSWQRTTVEHSVQEDELKITTSDCRKEENEVLLVLSAEKFVEMVFSFKQSYAGGHENLEELPQTLVDFTKHVKDIYLEKKVTFLISGLEKYMRNVKLKKQRAFRTAAVGEPAEENGTRKRRKKKTLPVLDVTRTDIEEALVDLQIKTNVCVYQCETDEDVALKIALFTKAVAERPYKKSLTDELGFCLDRLDKATVKVSKDGQGMVNVWQQQIQQFRNVSREMAAAIVAEYPSPQLLKQEYEQCPSVQDARLLLEDIMVRRGGGSLATSRRIGPELSRRFYILFHSKENSVLVKG